MNCLNEIKDLIIEERPEMLIINELNLEEDISIDNINIDGYNIEIDNLYKKGMARTGVYIKKNLNYKREKEFEAENESIVTLKVGYPKKKKSIHYCLL